MSETSTTIKDSLSKSYPIGFASRKVPFKMGPLDGDGIPMVKYKAYSEPVYFQVAVAQYGFGNHQLFVSTGEERYLETFLKCADWHISHLAAEPDKRFGLYYLKGPLTYLNRQDAPWTSAMGQGHALSIAALAYKATGDARYRQLADDVLPSFFHPVESNGMFTLVPGTDGGIFYEEWAFYPAVHILNGCLFAMQGLYDYLTTFGGEEANRFFVKSVKGLQHWLPRYDLGWWSRYSLGFKVNLASHHYQRTHIEQLTNFGILWDNSLMRRYGEVFAEQYANRQNRLKWQLANNWHKLYRRALLTVGLGELILTDECRRTARAYRPTGRLTD